MSSIDKSKSSQSLNIAPLIAGTGGGATSTILLYPLDLVKVRLQVNESTTRKSTKSNHMQKQNAGRMGNSSGPIIHMVRGIIRHEGVVGLYNGIAPAILGSAMSWGGYFFFYEGIKTRLLKRKQQALSQSIIHKNNYEDNQISTIKLGPMENFSAACLSGSIMVAFTNPIWLIKTRMQLQMKLSDKIKLHPGEEAIKPPYKNMFHAAKTIVQEEGFVGLYKGSIPALMLVSHGGVQFVCYEFLKGHFGVYQKAAGISRKDSVFTRLEDSLGYLTMGAISKMYVSWLMLNIDYFFFNSSCKCNSFTDPCFLLLQNIIVLQQQLRILYR